MSATPVRLAASSSRTSMCRPSMMARQCRPSMDRSRLGASTESVWKFSARARSRAVVVLPTPRTPVSMKAWAMRPAAKALRRVRTMASWP